MNKPTQKMLEFAEAIAEELGLADELDEFIDDFDEVSEFISDNKDDYYESIRMRRDK